MVTVRRSNWWVRWAGKFSYDIRNGDAVSLCVLFWSGALPVVLGGLLLVIAGVVGAALVRDAAVKEFAAVVTAAIAVVVGGANTPTAIRAIDRRLPLLREAAWGLKHRLCPIIRLED